MLAAPGSSPTLSLRLRILIVALLPLLVAVGLFAAYFAHRSTNEAESALTSKGRDSVRRLAEGIAFDLFTGNLPYVKRQMDLERHSIGAQSVAITDGQVWTLLSGAPGPSLTSSRPFRSSSARNACTSSLIPLIHRLLRRAIPTWNP